MRKPDATLGHLQVFGARLKVVHDHPSKMPAVVVELSVRDAHHGGLTKVTHHTLVAPHELTPDESPRTIRDCVMAAFSHEVDEWLRVDGRLVRDPHP